MKKMPLKPDVSVLRGHFVYEGFEKVLKIRQAV